MNIADLANLPSQQQPSGQSKSVLGKDDFMKLLVEQLKHQDPLNPMEGAEFAAQLAQFSSLEQLSNMNDKLESSINANYQLTQSVSNTMGAALIGKNVKIGTKLIEYNGQQAQEIGYNLAANASQGSLKIYNDQGILVKTIENVDLSKGEHKVSWDFTDNKGEKIGQGNYMFEFTAMKSDGINIQSSAYLEGKVSALRFTQNGTMFVINGKEYFLSDVTEIQNAEPNSEANDG